MLLRSLLLSVLVGVSVSGCGPVGYLIYISRAEEAVEAARQAGAEQNAPYEFYYAQLNLDKAREVAGHAEYQAAMDLAERAATSGHTAVQRAQGRAHESGR